MYVEPGWRAAKDVKRGLIARDVYATQLPDAWQGKLFDQMADDYTSYTSWAERNVQVVLVEWFDEQEHVTAALYSAGGDTSQREVQYEPIELERIQHGLGVCPLVAEGRLTLDGEQRGQWDQVVGMLYAHIRVMGLVIDYADQAVYSDVWVKDVIGVMAYGGGSYIELGPNGAIGRVPPAVSSLDVGRDLEMLLDGMHLGGRWPKSRPGEVDQSIASAKFLEASAGMMNTAIRTYHQILQRMITKAIRVAFHYDKKVLGGKRSAVGVLKNQHYAIEYDTANIDLDAHIRVEYGLGFGRDPAQSALLHVQYGERGYLSRLTVQENVEGITDIDQENARIDVEAFHDIAMAKILEGIQGGTIPQSALIDLAEKRADGVDLWDLYRKYIVEPAEALEATKVPTGLGDPQLPGPIPPGPVGAPPAPAAPEGAQLLSRLNGPAGPGGTLGSQVLTEG